MFDTRDRDAVYKVIDARRDMRHFAGGVVESQVLKRILEAGHAAPSVGFMQPWRFIRVTDVALREALATMVEAERQRTAKKLDAEGWREREPMDAVLSENQYP